MSPADFAHTARAARDRDKKAAALAARTLGVPAAGLALGAGRRRGVRLAAGFASVSEETWFATVQLLAADQPPANPPARAPRCSVPACVALDAELYPCGWRCLPHSPAAVAGRVVPAPPADSTLTALRAARGINPGAVSPSRSTAVDERAIASGKCRTTTVVYQAVRASQAHHDRRRRA
jgi:hypothetical protein